MKVYSYDMDPITKIKITEVLDTKTIAKTENLITKGKGVVMLPKCICS